MFNSTIADLDFCHGCEHLLGGPGAHQRGLSSQDDARLSLSEEPLRVLNGEACPPQPHTTAVFLLRLSLQTVSVLADAYIIFSLPHSIACLLLLHILGFAVTPYFNSRTSLRQKTRRLMFIYPFFDSMTV